MKDQTCAQVMHSVEHLFKGNLPIEDGDDGERSYSSNAENGEVQEQVDIIKSVAPQLHAAGAVLRRAFIPSLHLLESPRVPIRSRRLRIDATTALVAGGRGYSKLLMHLEKTLGVSVAFFADAVRLYESSALISPKLVPRRTNPT